MKFEVEIPDAYINSVINDCVRNILDGSSSSTEFRYRLRGIIDAAFKDAAEKYLNTKDEIIKEKVESSIEKTISDIVEQRLVNRVQKVLATQLKIREL